MFLGAGALGLVSLAIIALVLLFAGVRKNSYLAFIDEHYLSIGFIVSLSAVLFSLVYSEIVGFLPCYLCWYQRIFLFPLPIIFGSAIWHKDRKIVKYVLPLLAVGFVFAVYQSFFYYFGNSADIPCDASGISCYQQLVHEFGGLVSFPSLSLMTYTTLLATALTAHFYKKED